MHSQYVQYFIPFLSNYNQVSVVAPFFLGGGYKMYVWIQHRAIILGPIIYRCLCVDTLIFTARVCVCVCHCRRQANLHCLCVVCSVFASVFTACVCV